MAAKQITINMTLGEFVATLKFKHGLTAKSLHDTVDELCAHGIAKGCFQDYVDVCATLEIFSVMEQMFKQYESEEHQRISDENED